MPQITLRLPDDIYTKIQILTNTARLKYSIRTEYTKRLPGGRSAVIRHLLTLALARYFKPTERPPPCSNPNPAS